MTGMFKRTKAGKRNQSEHTAVVVAVFLILGLIVYGNTLRSDFVWDDYHLIKNNVWIQSGPNLKNIFSQDIGAGAGMHFGAYRPIQLLTYMADFFIWGDQVFGYHLTNIVLHVLVALAVFWLTNILFDHWKPALIASIFFAIHPVHTEAVAYISGRADSLAALFVILSVIFYIKRYKEERRDFYIPSLILFILALLSRENTIILPFLLLAYHYALKREINVPRILPFIIIAAVYATLRLTVLKHTLTLNPNTPSVLDRLPGFFAAVTNYARLLIVPADLHMEYGKQLFKFSDPRVLLGMVLFLFLIFAAFINKKIHPVVRFSIIWMVTALLPQSNVLFPINAYMAEHWLYLPSIGFFILFAHGLTVMDKTKGIPKRVMGTTIMIGIIFSVLTIVQNRYWRNETVFYERTLKYAPLSWKMWNALGVAYQREGRLDEAVKMFNRSLKINPNNARTYCNLGAVYGMKKQYQEALPLFQKALEIDPKHGFAYYNLGKTYFEMSDLNKAIENYKETIAVNPYFGDAHNNLSEIYYLTQQYDLAVVHCDKAIQLGVKMKPSYLSQLEPYRK